MMGGLAPGVATVFIAMFATLVAGSVVRLYLLRANDTEKARSRRASLRTWWGLAVLMTAAVMTGPIGVCVLLAMASWAGFSEYRELEARDAADRFASGLLRLTIPLTYVAIYLGWGGVALSLLPLVAVVLVATSEIVHGVTRGYTRSTGALVFGAVVLIGGPGHAALMVNSPPDGSPAGGAVGWFVYLVILTEINDIAQALVGRRVGVRRITPVVSPNKTWEGLLGGIVVTMAVSVGIASYLTPLATAEVAPSWIGLEPAARWVWPLGAGLVVGVAGFLGDLNISAVKRDVGVKDSSHALPGMGGVLDRIDSLTLTAPAFYWLIMVPTS